MDLIKIILESVHCTCICSVLQFADHNNDTVYWLLMCMKLNLKSFFTLAGPGFTGHDSGGWGNHAERLHHEIVEESDRWLVWLWGSGLHRDPSYRRGAIVPDLPVDDSQQRNRIRRHAGHSRKRPRRWKIQKDSGDYVSYDEENANPSR